MKNKKSIIFSVCFIILILFCILYKFNAPVKLKGETGELLYTNNNISLRIGNAKEENNHIKLLYNKDSKIEVTVKFDEKTKGGEEIKISLLEGLKFTSLPLKEVNNEDIFDYDVLIKENDLLYKSVNSVDITGITKEENPVDLTSYYRTAKTSVYGTAIYKLNPDYTSVTISFNISADMYRFYGDHNIEKAIRVEYGDAVIVKDVKLYSNDEFSYTSSFNDQYPHSKGVFASTSLNTEYGNMLYFYSTIYNKGVFGASGVPKYKSAVYEVYYPENTSYDSLISYDLSGKVSEINVCNLTNNIVVDSYEGAKKQSASCTWDNPIYVVNYPSESKIKILSTNNLMPNLFSLKYKVDNLNNIDNLNNNLYVEKKLNKFTTVTYEFYDGEIVVLDEIRQLYNFKIWNPNKEYNSLTYHNQYIAKDSFNAYDDRDNNTFIYGPYVGIENIFPKPITNQILEYEIDENYQVIGVSFPRESGIDVTNIKYKVYGNCSSCGEKDSDGWYSYGTLDKKSDFRFTIEDAKITEDDVYFSAVKGTVASYSVDYSSKSGAALGEQNMVLYGNLKSTADKASVNYYIYSKESERNSEENKLTKYVIREENPTVSILDYTKSLYNFDKKIINTGDSFILSGKISAYGYPYGTRMYIDDVILYIREPKDFSLNINDLKISYINENGIEEIFCESMDCIDNKNKYIRDNDTIYVINTGKSVGHGLTKKELLKKSYRSFNVSIPYKSNIGINIAEVNTNELLSVNSKEKLEYVGYYKTNDIYDMDNDNNKEETIPKLGSEKVTIQKTESFVAKTTIIKDGIQYGPYNEDNPLTIIDAKVNDIYEYNLKLINYTSKAAKFSIYIPVPKLGKNYGEKYQEKEFLWSVDLLEKLKYEDEDIFEFSYSTSNIFNKDSFKTNISNDMLKDVTMIKITSKKEIPIDKEYNVRLKFQINDKQLDFSSNLLNIWNPFSKLESESVVGEFVGEKTAMKLEYKEISGLAYLDINKNKIYDAGIDIPGVRDLDIELYKKVDKTYERVSKVDFDVLTGEFSLKDLDILTDNVYALKLTSTAFDCYNDDVIEGWIKDIDFTKNKKYYYEVGYITDEFAPSIKAEDAYIYVGDKIEFEKYIKEAYDYKKEKIEFIFGKNTTYSSDIPNNNGIATKAGIYYATYDVIDKYGNKASALIKIYVRERPVPPSTNDDITKYIIIGILSLVAIILSIVLILKTKSKKLDK